MELWLSKSEEIQHAIDLTHRQPFILRRPHGQIWNCYNYVGVLVTVENNKIGDSGCKFISLHNNWPKLDTLSLANNQIGEVGLKWLAKGRWRSLNWLSIRMFSST